MTLKQQLLHRPGSRDVDPEDPGMGWWIILAALDGGDEAFERDGRLWTLHTRVPGRRPTEQHGVIGTSYAGEPTVAVRYTTARQAQRAFAATIKGEV